MCLLFVIHAFVCGVCVCVCVCVCVTNTVVHVHIQSMSYGARQDHFWCLREIHVLDGLEALTHYSSPPPLLLKRAIVS